jgi:cellulose biosynthesis protein BcsQ
VVLAEFLGAVAMDETYALALALLSQGFISCIVRHDDHFDVLPAQIELMPETWQKLIDNPNERMKFQIALCIKATEMVEEIHDVAD